MALPDDLLDLLACPKCKGDLRLTEPGDGLVCPACEVVYAIVEDIPIMLIDEAVPCAAWDRGERPGSHPVSS